MTLRQKALQGLRAGVPRHRGQEDMRMAARKHSPLGGSWGGHGGQRGDPPIHCTGETRGAERGPTPSRHCTGGTRGKRGDPLPSWHSLLGIPAVSMREPQAAPQALWGVRGKSRGVSRLWVDSKGQPEGQRDASPSIPSASLLHSPSALPGLLPQPLRLPMQPPTPPLPSHASPLLTLEALVTTSRPVASPCTKARAATNARVTWGGQEG